jgi:hypothetical protein
MKLVGSLNEVAVELSKAVERNRLTCCWPPPWMSTKTTRCVSTSS